MIYHDLYFVSMMKPDNLKAAKLPIFPNSSAFPEQTRTYIRFNSCDLVNFSDDIEAVGALSYSKTK